MELIKRYKVLAAILAVVVAVGVGCWVYQLIFGLTVTGMNNGTSWGLYITNFMFFVGLSAGGLIVASSASVFHITKFKAVRFPPSSSPRCASARRACSCSSIWAASSACGAS